MGDEIRPFHVEIAQDALDDLRSRLRHARWPEAETIGEWKQGVPIADMQRLVKHWAENYDWRRCEAMLNGWGQHVTTIDGLHPLSPHPIEARRCAATHHDAWLAGFGARVRPCHRPSGRSGRTWR